MNNRIASALASLFEKHRLVFWYDAKKELRADFEAVTLPDVTKLEIANNEYALKYRILREEPEQKFLLYHEGPQPEDLQNWLLDVLLANGEFRTDQVGLWLSELDLSLEFADVIQEHLEFFRVVKRREGLKKLLKSSDTAQKIRMKMLAVCSGADASMEGILESLLQELAEDRNDAIKLVERCELEGFFWQKMQDAFGYASEAPSMQDFAIELFKSSYNMTLGVEAKLSADALVFLKRWKDNRKCKEAFTTLSERYAKALAIVRDLETRDYRDVLELDFFRVIDQKVISVLAESVSARTISHADLDKQVRLRRQSIWYEEFSHLYDAIAYASHFLHTYDSLRLEMESPDEAVQNYCRFWFRMDQLYRRFAYHARLATQPTLMGKLDEQIESLYANNFVLKLGDRFQEVPSALPSWSIPSVLRQDAFFETHVRPFLRRDNRVCVIISDAMRYEIGEELQRSILQEDKFAAELTPMLAMLPSYTQLGMAALLPHRELAIADNESATVLVDGMPSSGTESRTRILQAALRGRGLAITAEEILSMDREETRETLKRNDVIYIYHNRIDAAGDKKESEDKVFEAVHESVSELVRLIRKLTSNNISNLIVTADHGFLFQRVMEESDFAEVDLHDAQILYRNRRFVLGHNFSTTSGMHTFTSAQLGLAGDVQVQVPKSVHRLRLKGAGSRYVHGGASLQEILVPVVKVNKKRQSDISKVAVEIIGSSSSVITSGQLAITLYQRDAVTDKIHPRFLRAGIYTEDGELVSDSHDLRFDHISENPRDREQTVRFLLTGKADRANGKEMVFRLEEQLAGTSHYVEYASRRYILRRSFTTDFDF